MKNILKVNQYAYNELNFNYYIQNLPSFFAILIWLFIKYIKYDRHLNLREQDQITGAVVPVG